MPNLAGAYLRANWAYERLQVLAATIDIFVKVEADSIRFQGEIDSSGDNLQLVAGDFHAIPAEITMLLSEVVFHLRAGLDYVVYDLAMLDSGKPDPAGSQFPIEDTPAGFRGRRKSYLGDVDDAHSAVIEQLQPYNGGDWLARLRALSNRDKHRTITVTSHRIRMGMKPLDAPDRAPSGRLRVKVQFDGVLSLAFEDASPVIKTLDLLHTQVAQTIDVFRSDFGLPPYPA